jgi:site-specific recombinase XerD
LFSDVTTALISEYIASRQLKEIQNGTINHELATLQAMFRLGERFTMANGQPMVERLPALPSKLKEGKSRRGFLKDEQFAVLAANAKTPWLRAFIECDYKFGFRKSELLGLRKYQVDLIGEIIRLEDSKSGDPRTVVMTARCGR